MNWKVMIVILLESHEGHDCYYDGCDGCDGCDCYCDGSSIIDNESQEKKWKYKTFTKHYRKICFIN